MCIFLLCHMCICIYMLQRNSETYKSHVTQPQTVLYQSLVNMAQFIPDIKARAFENQKSIMWLLEDLN